MSAFEVPVNTGNPETDRQTVAQMQQQYGAQGMHVEAHPLPTGGYLVRVFRAPSPGPAGHAPGGPPVVRGDVGGKPRGLLHTWAATAGTAAIAGLVAAAATFAMTDVSLAFLTGMGTGIGLVFVVLVLILGRPRLLHTIAALPIGLAVAAGGSAAVWFVTHPSVRVDNQGGERLRIYVDGKKVASVAPGALARIHVHRGRHELGWSSGGDKKPTATTKASVQMFKEHLYNPGKTACYWLVVHVYGDASADGTHQGPQPIEEFYVFDEVDHWFTDNPEYVTINKNNQKGKTQTALQHAKMCMQLKECGLPVRERLVACQIKALSLDDDAAFESAITACGDEAERLCRAASGAPKAQSR